MINILWSGVFILSLDLIWVFIGFKSVMKMIGIEFDGIAVEVLYLFAIELYPSAYIGNLMIWSEDER